MVSDHPIRVTNTMFLLSSQIANRILFYMNDFTVLREGNNFLVDYRMVTGIIDSYNTVRNDIRRILSKSFMYYFIINDNNKFLRTRSFIDLAQITTDEAHFVKVTVLIL